MHPIPFYKPKVLPKSIADLPDSILIKVFSYLSKKELCVNAMLVCKRWTACINAMQVCKRLTVTAVSDELIQKVKFEKSTVSSDKICDVLQATPTLHSITLVSVPEIAVIIDQLCRSNIMLKEIEMKHCLEHIEESSLEKLFTTCIHLSKVNLKGTTFTPGNLYKSFSSLAELNNLTLSTNEEHLNSNRLLEIMFNCYYIEELKLYHLVLHNPTLTDDIISEILQDKQSTLQSLTLDCTYLTSFSYHLMFACSWLEKLQLKNALKFLGRDLEEISETLNLKTLKIERPYRLLNEDFLKVFDSKNKKLKNLIHFSLTHCTKLNYSGLEAILKTSGKNLTYLNVEGCSNLTYANDLIVKYCKNLKYLNVAFVNSIKSEFYKIIPEHFVHLEVLVVDNSADYNVLNVLQRNMTGLEIIISSSKLYKNYEKL